VIDDVTRFLWEEIRGFNLPVLIRFLLTGIARVGFSRRIELNLKQEAIVSQRIFGTAEVGYQPWDKRTPARLRLVTNTKTPQSDD
jgi:hypothetical protein